MVIQLKGCTVKMRKDNVERRMRDAESGKRLQNQGEHELISKITQKAGKGELYLIYISLGCKLACVEEKIQKIIFFED